MVVLLCHLKNLPQIKATLNQMRKVVQVMTVIDLNTVHPVIMTRLVTVTVQRKSPCIMCVQYHGGYLEHHGGYHEYCGVILSTMGVFSTMGDIKMHVGDIMSTMGVFSTVRGKSFVI